MSVRHAPHVRPSEGASVEDRLLNLRACEDSYLNALPPELMRHVAHLYEEDLLRRLRRHRERVTIVFLGDERAGVTSIIQRYTEDTYPAMRRKLHITRKVVYHEDRLYLVDLIDPANLSEARTYLANADACVVVADERTLPWASFWLRYAKSNAARSRRLTRVLCSSKSDHARLAADPITARRVARDRKALFFEVSARRNTGIGEMVGGIIGAVAASRERSGPPLSSHHPLPCHLL